MALKGPDYYNADYYQRGHTTGVSLYEDYRWRPDVTMRLAMAIIDLTAIQREQPILDFGCATGYLVKAFRLLFRDAYGIDYSPWAVKHADPSIREYIRLFQDGMRWPFASMHFRTIIAKDVLEHVEEQRLGQLLARFREKGEQLVVIVPLGQDGQYIIPYMEEEPDHVIRQPLVWWRDQLEAAGWVPQVVTHQLDGIKDQWRHYPQGHAILYAE